MNLRISSQIPYFPANEAPLPQVKNSIIPEAEAADEIQGPILEGSEAPLQDDLWGFKDFWDFIKKQFSSISQLYQALKDRHEDIRFAIEVFRPQIEVVKSINSTYFLIESLASSISSNGNYQIDPERLELIKDGVSGSYFLLDTEGKRRFIVKPTDEDTCCLNNPKGYNSPFVWNLFRRYMPLYFSAFREVVAYEVAKGIGVERIVPKTVLAILESTRFSYMSDRIAPEERERYLKECGPDLREKLCSLQEFIPNAKTLFEVIQDFQQAGLTDDEIEKRFDQKDFEDANILIWATYDTDAHAANILLYEKEIDPVGNQILGIKKIDNGLAFPDKNRHLCNYLKSLPNANRPLSEEGRKKIENLNLLNLTVQLKAFGLGSSVPALKQRIAFLKELVATPDITIQEINHALTKLGEKKQ